MARRAVLALTLMTCAWAGPAAGAVYEVGDDGSVARIDVTATAPLAAVRLPRTTKRANAQSSAYMPFVTSAGERYAVSPALIDAIAHVESRYVQSAVSPKHAVGIMQLMPATAAALSADSHDAADNIRGGTAYLRQLLDHFHGDVIRTIAAYNAGPTAVDRAGGVPHFAETRAYVAAVLDRMAEAATR
ncbi:MAG: lytic transglycosylase domain-containing protein [Janthinobacterium lividum]